MVFGNHLEHQDLLGLGTGLYETEFEVSKILSLSCIWAQLQAYFGISYAKKPAASEGLQYAGPRLMPRCYHSISWTKIQLAVMTSNFTR